MGNFNEYTKEVCSLKGKDTILGFSLSYKKADKSHFLSVFESKKVRFEILDYSQGTGDKIQKAYFNLDWEDFLEIYDAVIARSYDDKMERSKIITSDNLKGNDGSYPVTKITISRNTGRNYPWNILINNGRAQSTSSKYNANLIQEKSGTFVSTTKVSFYATDRALRAKMSEVYEAMNRLAVIFGFESIPTGLKILEDAQKGYSDANGNVVSEEQEVAIEQNNVQETETQSNEQRWIFNGCIFEEIQGYNNSYISKVHVPSNGQWLQYMLTLPMDLPSSVFEASRSKQPLNISVYQNGENLCFGGLV